MKCIYFRGTETSCPRAAGVLDLLVGLKVLERVYIRGIKVR